MPILLKDAIDRIAHVFTVYCADALRSFSSVLRIRNACEDDDMALRILVPMKLLPSGGSSSQFKVISDDIPRLKRCLERMWDIKCLARQAFAVNFPGARGDAAEQVFNQEVCFSYACKMLVSMGPFIQHFASRPSRADMIRAELAIAMKTPIYADDDMAALSREKSALTLVRDIAKKEADGDGERACCSTSSKSLKTDAHSKAAAGGRRQAEEEGGRGQAVVLECFESMPTPKQTRRSRQPQPGRSCR
jgi:hypothetical protein